MGPLLSQQITARRRIKAAITILPELPLRSLRARCRKLKLRRARSHQPYPAHRFRPPPRWPSRHCLRVTPPMSHRKTVLMLRLRYQVWPLMGWRRPVPRRFRSRSAILQARLDQQRLPHRLNRRPLPQARRLASPIRQSTLWLVRRLAVFNRPRRPVGRPPTPQRPAQHHPLPLMRVPRHGYLRHQPIRRSQARASRQRRWQCRLRW
jgi:hypothetical protein